MGGQKYYITDEEVKRGLREHKGNVAETGRALGIPYATFYAIVKRKGLMDIVIECKAEVTFERLDKESSIFNLMYGL